MANRYWVGGSGTWNTSSTTNWSASSGGPSGASVPTAADSVFFDQAGTYTVTLTGALTCLDITVSAGTVTLTGAFTSFNISGSMSLLAGTVNSASGTITFNATTTGKTVTTNGVTFGSISFNGIGGEWTLGSALTCATLDISNGSFKTAGYAISASSFNSNINSVRSIDLSSSVITCSSAANSIVIVSTNLTFNAGTSQFNINGSMIFNLGITLYNVAILNATAGTRTIAGPITYNNLAITAPASAGVTNVTFNNNQTINGTLSTTGTAGNRRVFFASANYGIGWTLTVNSAPSLTDADFRDLYVKGTAAPISGTRIGNRGNCQGITFSTPKTVYCVAAGASFAWASNNWSNTSSGAASTDYFPLPQDAATFTNFQATLGIQTDSNIAYLPTIDFSARTLAATFTSFAATTMYGSWTSGSGLTIAGTALITFSGDGTKTITSAGKAFTCPITVDTYGGTVQAADAFNTGGANNFTVNNGTFNTAGFAFTCGFFLTAGTGPKTISFGASTVTVSSGLSIAATTNTTLNAGTSTILVAFNGGVNLNFGITNPYNLSIVPSGISSTLGITSSNTTFNNFSVTPPAFDGLTSITYSGNVTINGTLTCAGLSAIRRVFVQSNSIGTQRTLTVNAISATDCDFRDINLAGAAAGSSPTRAGNCGNNSGITFPAPKTVYWNLAGSQNWSATGWCTGSGGTPDINQFPLAQDTAVFDNTGSAGTVSINAAWNIGTFDASLRTSAMTFTGNNNTNVYGDWKFGTGVTPTSTAGMNILFSKNGIQTITSNGVQFGTTVNINNPNAYVQLADAFSLNSARTLTLTGGTFDAVTYNVTTGAFSNSATLNTLKMGSGTWTLSGTDTVWSQTSTSTQFVGTSTIVLSNTSTTARSFIGGNLYYNKLTIGGTTGTSTLLIVDSNTFGELASTKTVAHTVTFTSSATTIIGKWAITGTAGNVVTVGPGTAASPYTISINGPANTGINYLSVSYCTVSTTSPGELYVGANSINTAGNTGAIIFTATPAPRNLYWVGGTGNWSSTTKWATSSGGVSGAAIPTSLDTVTFDSASNPTAYTATIDAGVTIARCAAFTMAGPLTGNVTWAGSVQIAMHGNVSFAATGITRTYTGAMNWTGNSSYTFATNGLSLANTTTINGIGATWTLGSALSNSNGITITYGSFSTSASNYAITFSGIFASSNNNIRSINLNGSTTIFSFPTSNAINTATTANLTFNAGTSQINLSGSTSGISSGGLTFYNVSFTSTAAASISITGANTFNNLTFTGLTSVGINAVTFSANQTINGTLTLGAGTSAVFRTFLASNTIGTPRTLTVNALAAGAADIDFRDIVVTGAAAPLTGTRFGDAKGNSGITFPAAKTVYFASGTQTSWASASWNNSNSTSGASVTFFPLAQDTAIFESFPNSGNTVTIGFNYNIGTIDMSLRTSNTMTLGTGSTTPQIYGNWINGTGTTLSGSGVMTFAGRGSQTITSSAKTFTQSFVINTPTGSVTLQDALTLTDITHTSGTLNANIYNVTFLSGSTSLISASTFTRTLALGSGTWTSIATGGVAWSTNTITGLTITGTGTISLTGASAKTFNGGGANYSGITLNQGGLGTLTIAGNNTFANITDTASGATTISLGATTQTVGAFTAAGTAGNLLTITGTSAASPATLIYTGGTPIPNLDYLVPTFVRAYPTTANWYVGSNSTNGGSLGFVFAPYIPPSTGGINGQFFAFF
jgi:hypothetical protein